MNADVEKAVERLTQFVKGEANALGDQWNSSFALGSVTFLSQALLDQEAEIDEMRERLQFWKDSSDQVHDSWQADKDRAEKAEAEIAQLRGVVDLIPTTWLDPLLTGPDAVIHGPPYDGRDFENLLRALRARITAHLGGEQ